MERLEDEISRIISNGGRVSDEESRLIFSYIKNLTIIILDVFKNQGKLEDMASKEGQGFLFKINEVYDALGIKCRSEYYDYRVFKDYILSVVTQVLEKAGYTIDVQDYVNSTSKEPSNDFMLKVHKDVTIIKLDANDSEVTDTLNETEGNNKLSEVEFHNYGNEEENYSNQAVDENINDTVEVSDVISERAEKIEDDENSETTKYIKWSDEFIQRMIYEWQHYFAVFLRRCT